MNVPTLQLLTSFKIINRSSVHAITLWNHNYTKGTTNPDNKSNFHFPNPHKLQITQINVLCYLCHCVLPCTYLHLVASSYYCLWYFWLVPAYSFLTIIIFLLFHRHDALVLMHQCRTLSNLIFQSFKWTWNLPHTK